MNASVVIVIIVGNEHSDSSSNSWMRLFAFNITPNPYIKLFSLQLWANSRIYSL